MGEEKENEKSEEEETIETPVAMDSKVEESVPEANDSAPEVEPPQVEMQDKPETWGSEAAEHDATNETVPEEDVPFVTSTEEEKSDESEIATEEEKVEEDTVVEDTDDKTVEDEEEAEDVESGSTKSAEEEESVNENALEDENEDAASSASGSDSLGGKSDDKSDNESEEGVTTDEGIVGSDEDPETEDNKDMKQRKMTDSIDAPKGDIDVEE